MIGRLGPPGLQGAKGETGVQGPRGQKGERGDGASGLMSFYKNWKECAWKNLNDEKDHGLIKVNDHINCSFFVPYHSTQLSQTH